MNRKSFNKEKLQNISIIGTLILIIIAIIFVLFIPSFKSKDEIIQEIIEHDLYIYKEDGTFTKYNTLSKKYLSEIKTAKDNELKIKDKFVNPFKTLIYKNKFIITSPNSKEIVIASEHKDKISEDSRISLKGIPNNIKIFEDTLAITYINSNIIDFYDLKTKKSINSIQLDNPVDSIEIDNNTLYVGTGNNIEIINKDMKSEEDIVKIHTGARTTSLYKYDDNYLYAGNIFASDSKNSLLIKIDIKNQNVSDILELEKEYPTYITSHNNDLVVMCKGREDGILDGVSIIDTDLFSRKTNISTGDAPNSITFVNSEFAYVSHNNGLITLIDMRKGYEKHSTFTIHGVKAISFK